MSIVTRYADTRLVGAGVVQRARDSFTTVGRMAMMAVAALRFLATDLVKGRFQWKETTQQAWFVVSVSAIPTLLVAVPFGVIISIQIGSLSQQVGASSFIGAASGLGVIRQGAPIVVALLLAGAVGSAICSDLGARTIREEIDALEVMGISPVRRLVAPRIVATVFVGVMLCGVVALAGVVTGFLFNIIAQGGTPGSYISSFASFARPADLVLAELKSAIFGFLVAIVASYKGLTAKGGPKGVADAVNASVVITVIALFAINVIVTEVYALLVPNQLA